MKPRKLGIPALRKYRSKAANWTDERAYQTEMVARAAGLACWQGIGTAAESFDGKRWTLDGSAVVVQGAPMVGMLALDAGCARCGEPMDNKGHDGMCSACNRELATKARLAAIEARDHRNEQDRMIEEAAIAEAA